MITGLQPLNRFNVPFPGAVPQSGIVRTFGAGEGGDREWTPMDANGDWEKGYPQMGEGVVGWAWTDLPGGTSWPTGVVGFPAPGGWHVSHRANGA